MFVRWQTRERRNRAFGGGKGPDMHWSAILVEGQRIDGKPVQRHVAYLGLPKAPLNCPHSAPFSGMESRSGSTGWRFRKTIARVLRRLSKPRCRALPGASTTNGLFAGMS